jgi:hypothetical protein
MKLEVATRLTVRVRAASPDGRRDVVANALEEHSPSCARYSAALTA